MFSFRMKVSLKNQQKEKGAVFKIQEAFEKMIDNISLLQCKWDKWHIYIFSVSMRNQNIAGYLASRHGL